MSPKGRSVLDLFALLDESLPPGTKGLPGDGAMRVGDLGARNWNLLADDLPFPVAVLRRSAIEHNSRWMSAFAEGAGLRLCPHGKTTMSPQLFERQLADGAWGITAATSAHIHVYLRFGVPRILHANQLVGRENIRGVFAALATRPETDFYTLVDSEAGLAALIAGLAETPIGRPLQLLLEIGATGGRTGVRNREDAIALAHAVADAGPAVALHGVECFEGVFPGRHSTDDPGASALLEATAEVALALLDRGVFAPARPLISGGGSAYYDLVARQYGRGSVGDAFEPILRSGCYLTHDSCHYQTIFARIVARSPELNFPGGLQPALEVWGVVQSRPEPDLVLVNLGKRDISHDIDLPRPLFRARAGRGGVPQVLGADHRVRALADQHLFLTVPQHSDWAVGDRAAFGVSHPCTTFDKWPLLFEVDDAYGVTAGLRTCF